jgi:hypothetical protein
MVALYGVLGRSVSGRVSMELWDFVYMMEFGFILGTNMVSSRVNGGCCEQVNSR